MTVRTNVGNGNSYIDMDIQTVSLDHNQVTFRAVIYLTSLNVTDSTNDCTVNGQWSRGGALAVGGVYNFSPVWYQDVSFGRTVGSDYVVGWNVYWSGVNYWGTTLSGTAYATVPSTQGKPSTPYGYTARNITTSSAYTGTISIADVAGGTWNNIRCQWGLSPDMNGLTGDRTVGSFADALMDGLLPGRVYYFRVAAANGYMWSDFGAVASFTSAAGVPATMAAPTITGVTSSTATVNFVPPADNGSTITSYGIEYATNAGFTGAILVGVGALTGLTRATPYWTRVRAQNAYGVSAWSAATTFTTHATVPDTMAAPTISAIGMTTATINYVAPNDGGAAITTYTVEWATNAGFTTGKGSVTVAPTPATANITGLTAGTPYWVHVRANSQVGNGVYSPATTFSSGATVPATIPAPALTSITDNSARLNWAVPAANGSPITEYHVNVTAPGFDITLVAPSPPLDINGLQPKTTHNFKVRAVNLIGPGTYSSASIGITGTGLGLNVGGTWKSGVELWMNVGGTWKYVTLYVNVGGANKKIT